jgi:hypothetical protein
MRNDKATIAYCLCCTFADSAQRLSGDCEAKVSDSASIVERRDCGCVMIEQRLRSDYGAILKQLRSYSSSIVHLSHSDCEVAVLRMQESTLKVSV